MQLLIPAGKSQRGRRAPTIPAASAHLLFDQRVARLAHEALRRSMPASIVANQREERAVARWPETLVCLPQHLLRYSRRIAPKAGTVATAQDDMTLSARRAL